MHVLAIDLELVTAHTCLLKIPKYDVFYRWYTRMNRLDEDVEVVADQRES